ncbi:hypothetical protein F66182_3526 [Fusarium sp. NRRL 66182]|nr:hypothetical protein F66182_3526 [Fusarium sp. NRRL 66182]
MDYRPNVYAAIFVTLPLATLVLVLRLVARRASRAGYGIDDCLAVVAYQSHHLTILVTVAADYGLGRPLEDGPSNLTDDEKLRHSYLLLWLGSLTYTIAIAGAKFAILTLYWRLFKYTNSRVPIQIVTVLCLAWFIVRMLLLTLQCIPTQSYWNVARRASDCHVDNTVYFYATVLTHAVLDVVILVLPLIEVLKMHLPLSQKIAVMALFGFGALVCVLTILVIVQSFRFNGHTREIALDVGLHIALAAAESNLTNVSVSLPMLRPVFHSIVPHWFLASHRGRKPTGDAAMSQNCGNNMKHMTNTSQQNGSSSMYEFAMMEDIPAGYDIEASRPGWGWGTEVTISSPRRDEAPQLPLGDDVDGIQIHEERVVHVERVL